MATRRVELGDAGSEHWFLYRKGDQVKSNDYTGIIVDGWCEYEVGGGTYQVAYVIEQSDGLRFNAVQERLVRIRTHPKGVFVRRHLGSAFPGSIVEDGERPAREVYWFRVENQKTGERYRAAVVREFLDDNPEDQIEEILRAWDLGGEMRRTPEDFVLVGETNCKGRISPADL